MAECSGPPQSARTDVLGTFDPSLEPVDSSTPRSAPPIPMHASTPLILRKSRMRKRARTDLCGGRSVMVVPTATVIGSSVGLVPINALALTETINSRMLNSEAPQKRVRGDESAIGFRRNLVSPINLNDVTSRNIGRVRVVFASDRR